MRQSKPARVKQIKTIRGGIANATSERYTGFTKSGTRIPADKFLEFRELVNSVNIEDLKSAGTEEGQETLEESAEKDKTE